VLVFRKQVSNVCDPRTEHHEPYISICRIKEALPRPKRIHICMQGAEVREARLRFRTDFKDADHCATGRSKEDVRFTRLKELGFLDSVWPRFGCSGERKDLATP